MAEELLTPISSRLQYDLAAQRDARLTTQERDILSVALVHATLATAHLDVAR
jgi:hypothetical protein